MLERVAEGRLSPAKALSLLSAGQAPRLQAAGEAGAGAPAGPGPEGSTSLRDPDSLQQVMGELHALIGLERVKRTIEELRAYVEIRQRRSSVGLASDPLVLHMAFIGNPGTGKTTVARLVGRMFKALGVLPKGHTVEVERADLVGEFVGHTAQRTREQIRKALGGVLFIDEAYSLARGGDKDFGKEAVDALVKAMEDHRHELVVVVAGYRTEMETFLRLNPGLRSRVPIVIDFPDYTGHELLQIADQMLKARQYRLSPEARERLAVLLLEERLNELQHFGNARLLRNILEAAVRRQAVRLQGRSHLTVDDLMLIRAQDIPLEIPVE
ncbi:AAA family ATPase [Carboxydochorda subterranea]|uniref:AAA family ATPase n=1 Tax=Carboxydichorda subterranea TaxID=3109565 RepID=A0ABZ1C319_9FIRM|nr:AAA family ATPase [Limnochorda sp. L945t]WRP18508.1 AAA family ATPase [Limnochorda sp. L945t]